METLEHARIFKEIEAAWAHGLLGELLQEPLGDRGVGYLGQLGRVVLRQRDHRRCRPVREVVGRVLWITRCTRRGEPFELLPRVAETLTREDLPRARGFKISRYQDIERERSNLYY